MAIVHNVVPLDEAVPSDWVWCGCGYPNRQLTDDEAHRLLGSLAGLGQQAQWTDGMSLVVLDELMPIMERYQRANLGLCSCKPGDCDCPGRKPEGVTLAGMPRRGCMLYRLWSKDHQLLYVGVSTRLRRRVTQHMANQPWADAIYEVTWDEHPDEMSMLAAEAEAIRVEHPAFNKAGV